MPEDMLLELEKTPTHMDQLRRLESALDELAGYIPSIVGWPQKFKKLWSRIVEDVAEGRTLEVQQMRPRLLCAFCNQLELLERSKSVAERLGNLGLKDALPRELLSEEIAEMERLRSRIFDRWESPEDLEDLAARDYPLTTADLERLHPHCRPPASWYAEEGKPF